MDRRGRSTGTRSCTRTRVPARSAARHRRPRSAGRGRTRPPGSRARASPPRAGRRRSGRTGRRRRRPGLGPHVVQVPDVDHPVGDPPPHAGLGQVGVLPGADPADLGIRERRQHRAEQPRLPTGVRVGENQDLWLASGSRRRARNACRVRETAAPSAAGRWRHGDGAALMTSVSATSGTTMTSVGFSPATTQAAIQDVRVLAVRRDHDRRRRGEPWRNRPVQPREREAGQPDGPGDRANQADRDHPPQLLPDRPVR